MTKLEIEELIKDLRLVEADSLDLAENPEKDCVNSSDYNYGHTDGINMLKGRSGFYD